MDQDFAYRNLSLKQGFAHESCESTVDGVNFLASMRAICALCVFSLLLSSCVSTSNLFQDGKSLGKKKFEFGGSLTLHPVPEFDESKITDGRETNFWLQGQCQYGLTKRLDIGAGMGLGGGSAGGQVLAKYALLPSESKTGIALLAVAGFSTTGRPPGDFQWVDHSRYVTYTYAIPVSFRMNETVTFVLQPAYGSETLTAFPSDSFFHSTYPTTKRRFESVKLGVGPIVDVGRVRLHINLTTAYIVNNETFAPSWGVAALWRLF